MLYTSRVAQLQTTLTQLGYQAFLVEDQVNLYYLTGLDLSAGRLLVTQKEAFLFVDGRYLERCQTLSPFPVIRTEPNSDTFKDWLHHHPLISRIAFSQGTTSFKQYRELAKIDQNFSRKIEWIPLDSPVEQLRITKDPEELEALQTAADLGSRGFDFLCELLKPGISEVEAATELEIFWKRQGAEPGFKPIIAFGANSSMPHYRPGHTKLKSRDSVLIDIGVVLDHYYSDMTRMAYLGTPLPKMAEIHAIVQEAQQAAIALCVPGTTTGQLDDAARSMIRKAGYGDQFLHGLGHGVGLEIHEAPFLRNRDIVLQPGMVITIEPGIYLPGIGGVRIEDTLLVSKAGPAKSLTKRPVEPFIK